MKNIRNILLSVGAAIASTKIIRAVSDLELDDVLSPMGLSRRRSHLATDIALLGAGAIVGGAVALIFAPMSGEETRRRISEKADELGDAASQKLRELGANVNPRLANSHSESHQRS